MRVVVITPPQAVVSLAEAKRHLRLDQGDGDENTLVAAYVAAAQGHIDGPDGWLGRAIGQQVLEARFEAACGGYVRLPFPPIVELVSVSYLDAGSVEQTADLDDIELRGRDLAALGSAWPWSGGSLRAEAVRVRYRAGYEFVPAAIRAAILLMAGDLYRHRDTVALGQTAFEVPMSTTVACLLSPFRVFG